MKIKTNVRAGKSSAGGNSSKAVGSIITFLSPLAALFVSRCSGI
jgi:hypothetical protein